MATNDKSQPKRHGLLGRPNTYGPKIQRLWGSHWTIDFGENSPLQLLQLHHVTEAKGAIPMRLAQVTQPRTSADSSEKESLYRNIKCKMMVELLQLSKIYRKMWCKICQHPQVSHSEWYSLFEVGSHLFLRSLLRSPFKMEATVHGKIYKTQSSRQNPLHVTSCYWSCYRFWGGALWLSRVLWKSAYARSNMKPKSNPKQAWKCIEELFCWFQVLRQQFMFLSLCVQLHACSLMCLSFACIFLSFCIHFLSFSFHVPLILISCSLHLYSCPLFSFHIPFNLHACSFHFAFISSHFLSKVMEMALRLGQGTECNKWLLLGYR